MKKSSIILITSILFVLSLSKAMAQPFNAGLIAGATFSQIDGDRYYGYNKVGLTAGGYVSLPFSNHFALQMELKYTQMGAHSSVKEVREYGYPEYDLRLHYAEIPLMLRFTIKRFAFEAGFSLDFLLKYRGEIDYSTELWKMNFFSATGNFGIHFNITDHFGVGARMMYSILPMQTNPTPQYWFDHSYNKVIQATVTYNFYSPLR